MTVEATVIGKARREISNGVVALLKEFVGRGPTSVRTFINDRLVLVVLEDTLTRAERTLAEEDRGELVREMRRAFMGAMGDRMRQLIEQHSGHTVGASMSDHSVLPDFAMCAFVLDHDSAPKADADASADPVAESADFTPGSEAAEEVPTERRMPDDVERREQQREIARSMVSLFKEYVGRGPTEAKTYIEQDVVAVLLGDTLTPAERTLAREREPGRVREIRREFQEAMETRAIGLVKTATGREVRAFLSDHSIFPDYAIEVCLLETVRQTIEPA